MQKNTLQEFNARIQFGKELFEDPNRQDEALVHFRNMAAKFPKNSYFKIRLTELLLNKRNWKEAELLTTELVAMSAPKYFAYQFHSTVLIKTGRRSEAVRHLEKAIESFPEKKHFETQLFLLRNMDKQIGLIKKVIS